MLIARSPSRRAGARPPSTRGIEGRVPRDRGRVGRGCVRRMVLVRAHGWDSIRARRAFTLWRAAAGTERARGAGDGIERMIVRWIFYTCVYDLRERDANAPRTTLVTRAGRTRRRRCLDAPRRVSQQRNLPGVLVRFRLRHAHHRVRAHANANANANVTKKTS